MSLEVAILDYGVGNLRSVSRALEFHGARPFITDRSEAIMESDALILPGVGAFGDAMDRLEPLRPSLREFSRDRPILGICLGLQLFFGGSEEAEGKRGLGLFGGKVVRLPGGVKIPHTGWNSLALVRESPLLEGIESGEYFYFVHSYYASPDEEVTVATTEYGTRFPAVIESKQLLGTQFHPERSGEAGLRVLENFVAMADGS